ncbi:MAG: hypothetical protein ACI88C_001296, partial [Acidimicrobiales bacterium]
MLQAGAPRATSDLDWPTAVILPVHGRLLVALTAGKNPP